MSIADRLIQIEHLIGISDCWVAAKQLGRRVLKEYGHDLSIEQVMIIHLLTIEEGLNSAELAVRVDRDRTSVSRMIDGLERMNLAVRIPDKNDRRKKLIYSTKLGRSLHESLMSAISQIQATAYEGLGLDAVKSSLKTLKRMFNNIKKQ